MFVPAHTLRDTMRLLNALRSLDQPPRHDGLSSRHDRRIDLEELHSPSPIIGLFPSQLERRYHLRRP